MKIPVRYNHVGYAPDAAKIFFVNPAELPEADLAVSDVFFRIVRVKSDKGVAWDGNLLEYTYEHRRPCEYTGERLWSGDFSGVLELGVFAIQLWKRGSTEKLLFETPSFEISNDWIYRQLLANIKSFYYQRSGVELDPDFAGTWARPAAHLDDHICFHPSMQREGVWNAHGGWYDAGDYGKYIVNGGVSVASLLLACELAGDGDAGRAVHAPEPLELPNGLKMYSLKEEVRFELEFFLRMQDTDGGVFFKVTPERWDGFVSPKDSDLLQKRMVLGKSTTSTLNFAGPRLNNGSCTT